MYNSSLLTVEMVPPRARDSMSPVPQDGRSKNARAQARHREKRKAYIRQLEETLSRLQTAMSLTGDRIESIPSSLARLRELERENQRLRAEVQSLRRHVTECLYTHAPQSANPSENGGVRKRRRSGDYTQLRTTANFAIEQPTPIPQRGDDAMDPNMPERATFSFTPTPSNDSSESSTHSTPSTVPDTFCPSVDVYVTDNRPQNHYADYTPPHSEVTLGHDQSSYTYSPNHDNAVFPKRESVEDHLQPKVIQETLPSAQYSIHDSRSYEQQHSANICHNPAYSGWAAHSAERRAVLHCI